MSELKPAPEPDGRNRGFHQAIHLRIAQAEATRLEAYSRRISLERNAQVTLSEAIRELLAQALDRQEVPSWEVALKTLPFVTWSGGKPCPLPTI